MLSCKRAQERLPQYIADGECAFPRYEALRTHLASCPECRAYARRLRLVEEALHTYPRVHPNPLLTDRILKAVGRERAAMEEWHPLSWDVWVPIVVFVMALFIASASLPQGMLARVPDTRLTETLAVWPYFLQGRSTLWGRMERELLWAIASGIFATMAGLGMGITLAYWSKVNAFDLGDLEQRLTSTAQRLWKRARHV
ncbi:MAG: zf-HC2 domain-containing protein [Anaerolineales bacterium]